jgi:septal ring factor EnvC (AmiA/AmiB activator)
MAYDGHENRKRIHLQVSLGSIIAALVFAGSAIGVYTQVVADSRENKGEIRSLRERQTTHENTDKEARQDLKEKVTEVKEDVKAVKQDVKEINDKLDRILQEVRKKPQ